MSRRKLKPWWLRAIFLPCKIVSRMMLPARTVMFLLMFETVSVLFILVPIIRHFKSHPTAIILGSPATFFKSDLDSDSFVERLHYHRSHHKSDNYSSEGDGGTPKLHETIVPELEEFVHAFWNLTDMRKMFELSPKTALCALKKQPTRMLSKSSRMFDEAPYARRFMPAKPFLNGRRFKSCAVVSNSMAMVKSNHGANIDAHDIVVRLNDAPIDGFEAHVGKRKADVRFFSNHLTRLVADASRNFTELDNHKATLMTWDHCCCGYRHYSYCIAYPTEERLVKLDLSVYTNDIDHSMPPLPHKEGIVDYLARRRLALAERYYMLDWGYPWELWEIVQRFYPYEVERDPPSHSFLAIITMMHHCDTVRAYEFLPSKRNPGNLHNYYYQSNHNFETLRRRGKDGRVQVIDGFFDFSHEPVRTSFHLKLEEMAFLFLINRASVENLYVDGVATFTGLFDDLVDCKKS